MQQNTIPKHLQLRAYSPPRLAIQLHTLRNAAHHAVCNTAHSTAHNTTRAARVKGSLLYSWLNEQYIPVKEDQPTSPT